MTAPIAKTAAEANANRDWVYHDTDGPGEDDGFPWCFAPDDSAFVERFATVEQAQVYAAEWIANRGGR